MDHMIIAVVNTELFINLFKAGKKVVALQHYPGSNMCHPTVGSQLFQYLIKID